MGKGLDVMAAVSAVSAVAIAAGAAAAQDRPGKAVRVERVIARDRTQPRVMGVSQTALSSYGWAPRRGEHVVLVDAKGVAGTAIITDVAEKSDACPGRVWESAYRVDDETRAPGYGTYAFRAVDVAPSGKIITGAHMVAPSGRDHENVWLMLDRAGFGAADLIVTNYACPDDELGRTVPGLPYCMDTYVKGAGDAWERKAHDVWYACH